MHESVNCSCGGRLFYTKGPAAENAWSLCLVGVFPCGDSLGSSRLNMTSVGINVDEMY